MIDVQEAIAALPHFDTYCSVAELHALAERLGADDGFTVDIAGRSANGAAIHHVRFGHGSVKALFVAGPHAMEPIGGLTAYSLMTLLAQGNRALLDADVEWHIVPCIDPDATMLNEGWTQKPFTLDGYIRNFWVQPRPDQVDFSFPIDYKKLHYDRPSTEAKVLQGILDRVRPDYFFTLHNYGPFGGAWFALSRDIGPAYYRQIHDLVGANGINLQTRSPLGIVQFSGGMREVPNVTRYYDYMERQGVPIPAELTEGKSGASSYDYLLGIHPDALVFVAELTYGRLPGDVSDVETGQHLRRLKLRVDADGKFLATAILEEWDNVRDDLDESTPFYRKILTELIEGRDTLQEGVSEWYVRPIRYLLFNPADAKIATERERIEVYSGQTLFLGNAYSFVRLLKESKDTPGVRRAIARLDELFQAALDDMKRDVGFNGFEVFDCDRLAKVQLGSGLIALNSLLE